jgi:NADH-quinone oxidoreductase subunit G
MKVWLNDSLVEAQSGQTIIEIADEKNIKIPRFCYHKKLSVAANCRMCLVEVNNSGKTVPACSTKITDGMKISTNSNATKLSQRAVLEFLLANHPLDCPICDQGGECELQDLSLKYGSSSSSFFEEKRVVKDNDLGPLITTNMTRCIHCTRCVRFGEEVCGQKELGVLNRGDSSEIKTYLKSWVNNELSGNLVDLCPVGALNDKPYAYSARTWELNEKPGILLNDCLGTPVLHHVKQNTIKRTVSNGTQWIADYDRYSYCSLYAPNKINTPLIRENNVLVEKNYDLAIKNMILELSSQSKTKGALVSPNTSLEEVNLLYSFFEKYNIQNKDFRLKEDSPGKGIPHSNLSKNDLLNTKCIVLIGADLDKELPTLSAIIREINPDIVSLHHSKVNSLLKTKYNIITDDYHQGLDKITKYISENYAGNIAFITGEGIYTQKQAVNLYNLISKNANKINARILNLTYGANYQALHKYNFDFSNKNLSTKQIVNSNFDTYIWYNTCPLTEIPNLPKESFTNRKAKIICFTPFLTDYIKEKADVILPITTPMENSGSMVNIFNEQIFFKPAVKTNAKSGYEILSEVLNIENFSYYKWNSCFYNPPMVKYQEFSEDYSKSSKFVSNLLLSNSAPYIVKRLNKSEK